MNGTLNTVLDFLLECIQFMGTKWALYTTVYLYFICCPTKKKKQKLYKICCIKHLNRGRTWVVIFVISYK